MQDQTPNRQLPRLAEWWLIALVLTVLVALLAPQQLPVSLYKLSLISLAAVAGYWLDRRLFPYARPDACLQLQRDDMARIFAAAMIRRALIVSATMLAIGLGA